ncbi:hypothetical protein OG762_26605 [Streptomyces sp. NBC_01136]|uniref:hypothetical protein n=1 Tax=unclassified Streptomyces TaxID=2593676 RepID=UPI003250E6E3|nr:hypothetical protein OG762_26605 [Streptomyces sp. NBC_01136]
MGVEAVTAGAATVIALGSLYVSIVQSRLSMRHNKQSVRPLLQQRQIRDRVAHRAGIELINAGLGPAIVTRTLVYLDGEHIGQWTRPTFERVLRQTPEDPEDVEKYALPGGVVLLSGQSVFLLRLTPFDRDRHAGFGDLVLRRLRIEIHYESLYGGEDFVSASPPI